MPRGEEDYIGSGRALSFLEAIPKWHERAACAVPPNDDLTWTCEPTSGQESAATVLRCFAVCAGCPVRRECLMSALEETRFTPIGIFGATAATERRAAWNARIRAFRTDTEYRIPSSRKPEGVSAHVVERALSAAAVHRVAGEIADELEATFEQRFATWEGRVEVQTEKSKAANERLAARKRAAADAAALQRDRATV